MAEHFLGLRPGQRVHAHTGACIKCGSDEGDTVLEATVVQSNGRVGLRRGGAGSNFCPACREKYLPITPAMSDHLDELKRKLWRDLMKRGCPCCEAGLQWYPSS